MADPKNEKKIGKFADPGYDFGIHPWTFLNFRLRQLQ